VTTLQTPRGTKFRCESKRRFLLVNEGTGYTGRAASMNRAIVMQRSDSLATLRTVVRRQEIKDEARYGEMVDYTYIIDSRTGQALPLRQPIAASVHELREGDTIRFFGEGQPWRTVHAIDEDALAWRLGLDDGWHVVNPQTTVRRLVRDDEITKD
jgi:hypothetical protein